MSPRKIIILVLAAFALLFLLQNSETVSVSFLFWNPTMPRALLLAITLVIGILIGMFLQRSRFGKS